MTREEHIRIIEEKINWFNLQVNSFEKDITLLEYQKNEKLIRIEELQLALNKLKSKDYFTKSTTNIIR